MPGKNKKLKRKMEITIENRDDIEAKIIRLRWLSQGAAITAVCSYDDESISFKTKIPLVEIAFSFCCPTDNYSAQDGLKRAFDRLSDEFGEDSFDEKEVQSAKRNRVRMAASSGEGKDLDRYIVAALRHMRSHRRLPTWLSKELKKQDKLAKWAKPLLPFCMKTENDPIIKDSVDFLVNYSWLINREEK